MGFKGGATAKKRNGYFLLVSMLHYFSINYLKVGNLKAEVFILKKNQREKNELKQVELGSDLSPDDLDLRSNQKLSKEQMNNVDFSKKIDQKASKKNK